MNKLHTLARSLLPKPVRRTLRATHRYFIFSRTMKQFLKGPRAFADPENPLVADLVYGWGNDWSAQKEYLAACIGHVLASTGPVLECGSGLTTIVLGFIASQRSLRYWALEHSLECAARTQRLLARYRVESVVLSVTPLKDHGEFCWYDPPLEAMPDYFSLVVCDGPPGQTKGGRYGLVPVMRRKLRNGCVILLDDADREGEQAISQRWGSELPGVWSVRGSIKPYMEMTVTTGHDSCTRPLPDGGDID